MRKKKKKAKEKGDMEGVATQKVVLITNWPCSVNLDFFLGGGGDLCVSTGEHHLLARPYFVNMDVNVCIRMNKHTHSVWVYLFRAMSTLYGLFNAETCLISKCYSVNLTFFFFAVSL